MKCDLITVKSNMAKCVQSTQEFIYNAFPAMVGALASEDAEAICKKNDLSFVELIRPFCQLASDGKVFFSKNLIQSFFNIFVIFAQPQLWIFILLDHSL